LDLLDAARNDGDQVICPLDPNGLLPISVNVFVFTRAIKITNFFAARGVLTSAVELVVPAPPHLCFTFVLQALDLLLQLVDVVHLRPRRVLRVLALKLHGLAHLVPDGPHFIQVLQARLSLLFLPRLVPLLQCQRRLTLD
jgi:hypothetical protein